MTRLGNTRTPALEEVLRVAVDSGLGDTHTAMPGRVEKYDAEKQKADVKPLLKRTVVNDDGTEETESLPVITDVPIMFPRAGGFFITFPVEKGDFVLLVFCERSIDIWTAGDGSEVDPIDLRMHDLSDAVAFPCFYPFHKSLKDTTTEGLTFGKKDKGAQVTIKNGGVVEVTYDDGITLTLEGKDGDAKLTLGDGAKHVAIVEALQTLWTSLKSTLDVWGGAGGHTHLSAAPGSPTGPPVPPLSTPAWDTSINSTKVSIPDG